MIIGVSIPASLKHEIIESHRGQSIVTTHRDDESTFAILNAAERASERARNNATETYDVRHIIVVNSMPRHSVALEHAAFNGRHICVKLIVFVDSITQVAPAMRMNADEVYAYGALCPRELNIIHNVFNHDRWTTRNSLRHIEHS